MTMPKMIFHVPYPLNPASTAASGLRPVRMREAFEAIGYEVAEVSGTSAERRPQIRELKRRIRAGEHFDFVYSEASTKPTAMTESHSLPTHPLLDLNFLSFCSARGIAVGLFYRDVYWREAAYLEAVPRAIAVWTRLLYRWDLMRYRRIVKRLFVPSLAMVRMMPHTDPAQCEALPPASDPVDSKVPDNAASLFYVGGIGSYYRLHEVVRAVADTPGARLTLCTRAELWQAERASYEEVLSDATRVVHASGAELAPLYDDAAIGCLFMQPIAYREFAAPMKLYEYLGNGKPIIATEGSLAAAFVAEHGVGWVLPYEAAALSALLKRLQEHPEEYERVRARVLEVRQEHSWQARARQAAAALSGK